MKKVTTTDLRTIRTRKLIHETFEDMLKEMDMTEVTVKALCERAGINRKTFYCHYDSIDALQQEIMLELIQDLRAMLKNGHPHTFRETMASIFVYLCNLPGWYRNMLCAKDSPIAKQLMMQLVDDRLGQYRDTTKADRLKYYLKFRYIAAAHSELFRTWNEFHDAMSIEEFVDIATGLICEGEEYI